MALMLLLQRRSQNILVRTRISCAILFLLRFSSDLVLKHASQAGLIQNLSVANMKSGEISYFFQRNMEERIASKHEDFRNLFIFQALFSTVTSSSNHHVEDQEL